MSGLAFAQSSFGLNTVVTITDSLTDSYPTGTSTFGPVYTVPAGKSWKIESILASVVPSSYAFTCYVNGAPFRVNTSVWNYVRFPIWLNAGSTIQFEYNFASGSTNPPNTEYYVISLLEFDN